MRGQDGRGAHEEHELLQGVGEHALGDEGELGGGGVGGVHGGGPALAQDELDGKVAYFRFYKFRKLRFGNFRG